MEKTGAAAWLERHSAALTTVAAAMLGAVLFFWTFPVDLLTGGKAFWGNPGDDNSVSFGGYLAFANDSWRFPIFKTVLLDPPTGVNAIFIDPIPLLAVFGKAAGKLLSHPPNYFGAWLLFCYMAQGVMGVMIGRQLGIKSFLSLLSLGALCLLMPSFIFRFRHFALCGHFLILLAVYFYIRLVTRPAGFAVIGFSALFAVMILIHPYLFAMVGAIFLAALAESVRRRTMPGSTAVLAATGSIAAAVALIGIAGAGDIGSAIGTAAGFGLYSMNLLSPVWPQLSGFFPSAGGVLDATNGQHEGYNYFGLGIVFVIVTAVATARRNLAGLLLRHRYLAVVAVLMALYALSFDIWAGSIRLTHFNADTIPFFRSIAGTFRASGRFFWPLAYLTLIAAVVMTSRALPRRWAPVILTLAAIVQLYDTSGVRADAIQRAHRGPPLLDRTVWAPIVQAHKAVVIRPVFLCAAVPDRKFYFDLLLTAETLAVPVNSALVNRGDADCEREHHEVVQDPFAEPYGSPALHLFIGNSISPSVLDAARTDGMNCFETAFGYACSRAVGVERQFSAAGFPRLMPRPYALGTMLNPKDDEARQFLGAGWSLPEPWGIWGVDEYTQILLPLAAPPDGDLVFSADLSAFGAGDYLVRTANISVNGVKLTSITVKDDGPQKLNFTIPRALAASQPTLKIEFAFDHPRSPQELRLSTDTRHVTWGFRSFGVSLSKD